MASFDNLGAPIRGAVGLLALVPGAAAVLGIVTLPPDLRQLLTAIALFVGVVTIFALLLGEAQLRKWQASLAAKRMVIVAGFAVICAVAVYMVSKATVIHVPEDLHSEGMLVLPLWPSGELKIYLARFGGDYAEALASASVGPAVLQLIQQQSWLTTIVLSLLFLLTQMSFTWAVILGALRLTADTTPA